MQGSQTAKRAERLNRASWATLAMSAIGICLSVGSWSATRDASVFGSSLFEPAAPMVMALAALALAIAFRNKSAESGSFFRTASIIALVLVLCQVFSMALAPIVSESERFSLGVAVTGAEGISSALLTFIFLASLTRFSPKQIAVTVATGYLLVHLYDSFFLAASADVRLLQRPVALVIMAILACTLSYLKCKDMEKSAEGNAEAGAAERIARTKGANATDSPRGTSDENGADGFNNANSASASENAEETGLDGGAGVAGGTGSRTSSAFSVSPASSTASERLSRPKAIAVDECVLFACFVCVPLMIQGVYSQLTGLGSVGNVQEFNLFTELFAAGVRVAVLTYCLFLSRDLSQPRIAALAIVICLVGIPLVEMSWGTGAYLVGSHIINSVRYALLPLVSIAGVQAARRIPERSTFLVLLMIAAANSCYVSRFATAELTAFIGTDISSVLSLVSLWSVWIIACTTPVFLLIWQRMSAKAARAASPLASVADPSFAANAALADSNLSGLPLDADAAFAQQTAISSTLSNDSGIMREIRFYQRLESLSDEAQLSEREKEILREVLHGYSIDSISSRLGLSTSTVKTYLSRAYSRFGVNSRQAILNLIDSEEESEKPRE